MNLGVLSRKGLGLGLGFETQIHIQYISNQCLNYNLCVGDEQTMS